jgi:hypothetical protein
MLARIKEIKCSLKKTNAQFNESEKKYIKRMYLYYFNNERQFESACRSCYVDAYVSLLTLYNNPLKLQQMEQQRFKLQEGRKIQMAQLGGVYTPANMTDDIAVSILRINSGFIKLFQEYPANWRELIGGQADSKETQTKSEPEAEPKEPTVSASQDLENLSAKELKALCSNNEFPVNEWKGLKKVDLRKYVISKTV